MASSNELPHNVYLTFVLRLNDTVEKWNKIIVHCQWMWIIKKICSWLIERITFYEVIIAFFYRLRLILSFSLVLIFFFIFILLSRVPHFLISVSYKNFYCKYIKNKNPLTLILLNIVPVNRNTARVSNSIIFFGDLCIQNINSAKYVKNGKNGRAASKNDRILPVLFLYPR